jgi:cyclase
MPSNIRLIARLDIKGPNLIKGIHLEGLRVIGNPNDYAKKYYESGVDEIIYMDTVASLYGRNNLSDIVKKTVKDVYVPITVGGGLRSIDDVKYLLRCGAEKVAINTAATKNPELITEVSRKFGSQCMVLSIEAKRNGDNSWEVYTENGRQKTGMNVLEWAKKGEELEAGEILLTSVDYEGTKKGFDYELIKKVSEAVSVPVIASGGMGCLDDMLKVVHESSADAVAMADILHYERSNIKKIREYCHSNKINVREYEN